MRVIVTGGCGYVGSVLVPKLLDAGHTVRVLDIQWFGNYLKPHPRLKVFRYDIRNPELNTRKGICRADALIHLAGIANDPTGELDPKLTWETNALATMHVVTNAYRVGVKHFIYASSGSVYGVSEEPEVTERHLLFPLSEYNKTKMVAERVVRSYRDGMDVSIVRPATVCGWSPRMRLDVAVNAITMMALEKGHIEINGGEQYRPNIHIEDMCDLYLWLLDNNPTFKGLEHLWSAGVYNAGFENLQIKEIAAMVAERLGVGVTALPTVDPRSYRVNSDRLLNAGFKPKKTVANAIDELIARYRAGELTNEERWYNLKAMKKAA